MNNNGRRRVGASSFDPLEGVEAWTPCKKRRLGIDELLGVSPSESPVLTGGVGAEVLGARAPSWRLPVMWLPRLGCPLVEWIFRLRVLL
eukprot:4989591-Amphidinium_carterae.1